jgi:cytoskeleton protein RodZ
MFEIGSSLREARLRQSLDFPELEQSTKIRAKYLRALEEEEFALLPAQTYVKGFLRAYAEYLGLDGQLYVDEFNSRYVVGEEETPLRPRRSQRPAPPRVQSRVVLLTVLGIALVTALVIVAWTRGGSGNQNIPGLASTRTPATPAAGKPKRQARSVPVKLVVRATRGSSWIRVQRDPPKGALLYQDWLDLGQTRVFTGRWLRLEARDPSALVLRLNGKRVAFPVGTSLVTVTTHGLQSFSG